MNCKNYLFELQKWGFYIAKVWFLFFECCVVAIRQQHYWQAVSSCRGRFIVPAYLYSTCICNPFETHLCNVRNVLVICVLHIRRAKVWFLACKNGVFTLRKYRFCFLNVVLLQSVSNIIGRLSAAVGADLSRPHIYIRHAFAIRLKHIYVMFATCSLSVCYIFAV